MVMKEKSAKKTKGQVYTPSFIVRNILDMVGYAGQGIIKKNIIDNSCGEGAFLTEIVRRYCEESIKLSHSETELKSDLEKYIFGVEVDKEAWVRCLKNLDETAEKYGIKDVRWNVLCADTLSLKQYDNKMDFVVGNPPYVRVHNLEDINKVKSFGFSKEGMTDLFIVFFEIGIKMLKKTGILGYITPSSYFTSKSGKVMRNYFVSNHILTDVVDLKHNQIFDVLTYTAITILKKNNSEKNVRYYEYDCEKQIPCLVDILTSKEFCICNNFYFSKREKLSKLKEILSFSPLFTDYEIDVKNGFATLCDNFFIQDELPFDDYVVPVLKGSTGKWKKCFFPYENGKLISLENLQKNAHVKKYYLENESVLKERNLEKQEEWWGFGRTQGIKDVCKIKYSINALVKTKKDIKLIKCENGTGVYSGLYILTNKDYKDLEKVIISEDFINYIELLGKYKSGGYYTFSSKDIKQYLSYALLGA